MPSVLVAAPGLPRLHSSKVVFTYTFVVVFLTVQAATAGQQAGGQPAETSATAISIEGPDPPIAPAVITRDDEGRATMRAVRIDQPLRTDGRLDEEVYQNVQPAGGFIQQEPHEGEPATEQTHMWVFFDERNLYVSARCFDSHPERGVVNEMRRDGVLVAQNESFSITFDTFYDRRNGFYFATNPAGAVRDLTVTDEGDPNADWNTIWDVKTGSFEEGWTVEMIIPFKSLRYRGAGPQTWGLMVRRVVRWKNETSFITAIPAAYGVFGMNYMSLAATLVGLETPAQSMNLELKPYLVSSLTTDRTSASPFNDRSDGDVGFDFKYGLTRSLIADVTYNTDFAQVEEDLQQINLTRFRLLFPEKRDFFLEGQGFFNFGGISTGSGTVAAPTVASSARAPILFFSRRIGLSQNQAVPVVAGGRVTGKAGRFGIGALGIRTDDKPEAGAVATNFLVVRLKRDILSRSNIGVLATRRSPSVTGTGPSHTVGFDANFYFLSNLSLTSYYARTDDQTGRGNRSSYRGRFDYTGDRYGLTADHLLVGDRFIPKVGFTRRLDFRSTSATARFSPRVQGNQLIRKLNWEGNYRYITDATGRTVQNRETQLTFRLDLENSDMLGADFTHDYELLPLDFSIAPGVTVPRGGYTYDTVRMFYTLGQQRRVSGRFTVAVGTLYGGRAQEVTLRSGRAQISRMINLEPGVTLNWVDLPQGDFTTRLLTNRTIITPTPRMMITSLIQFNQSAHTLSSSVRLRWEYAGGSELFVVYSDGRQTTSFSDSLLNRSFAVKVTRLFRF